MSEAMIDFDSWYNTKVILLLLTQKLEHRVKESIKIVATGDQKDETSNTLPIKPKIIKAEDVATKEPLIKQSVKEPEQKPVKKQAPKTKPAKPDDFTKLFGVGPSMSKHLKRIGLNSFQQLSELDTEELIEKLTADGVRVINKSVMASWAEQAILADAGDFKGLKALQDKLKKG